jgi:hypothetical protein
MNIKLTAHELMQAVTVGGMRQISALMNKLPDKHGFDGPGWSEHIEGFCGELAVAKAINCYCSGSVNTFKVGGDLGEKIQVRTRSKHSYELIVRPGDRDDDVFVLVTGRSPDFVVRGWIAGRDAKRDDWKKTHGGRDEAFFVPQAALEPMARF